MSDLQQYTSIPVASSDEDVNRRLAELQQLPMNLVLEVEVADFTVGTLMELELGAVLATAAQQNEDLMLRVNGQPVGPVKFDVTGDRLAVRLTGIA